jgi:hypothetical protein
MNVLEKMLPKYFGSEMFRLISSCWDMIFESRKTELFWTTMEAFLQMLFQPSVMTTEACQDHLLQVSYYHFLTEVQVSCHETGLTCMLCQKQLTYLNGRLVSQTVSQSF